LRQSLAAAEMDEEKFSSSIFILMIFSALYLRLKSKRTGSWHRVNIFALFFVISTEARSG
jgi:hypothetical protein